MTLPLVPPEPDDNAGHGDVDPLGFDPPPDWPDPRDVSAAGLRDAFSNPGRFSLGAEEELMLLDPVTLDVAPRSEHVLSRLAGDGKFHRELLAAQLEIVTPVLQSAPEIARCLASARRQLVDALHGEVLIAGSGVHPGATQPAVVSASARYAAQEREYRWAVTGCGQTFGLHIHVAVPGPDRALAVYNALRSYLPELIALGANAPIYQGRDTGLCSVRPKLTEAFSRAGVPPSFASWDDFLTLIEWGRRSGSFPDHSHLWWDLRPHPTYGTLEIRVPDAQTRSEDAGAIAGVVQALAVHLAARFDAGETLPVHSSLLITENRWRALRHGLRGWLADLDTGDVRPTRLRLLGLLEELREAAASVGAEDALAHARTLAAGNGAERQRYVAAREGLPGLLAWLARESCNHQQVSTPMTDPASHA
jgi:carboxylate-amine ligase